MVKVGIIYKATCLINKKAYIGQTIKTMNIRKWKHINSSKKKNDILYNTKFSRALRKHGEENFIWKIILSNIPKQELNGTEIKFIEQYDSYCNGYNSNLGGGSNSGYKPTPEAIEKCSSSKRGIPRSDETKRKISEANKGKPKPKMSDETKKKISLSKMGSKNPNYGKKETEEHKRMRSNIVKKSWTKEKRQQWSKKMIVISPKGENHPHAKLTRKKVNEIRAKYIPYKYSYYRLAKEYKVSYSTIWEIINNKIWIKN